MTLDYRVARLDEQGNEIKAVQLTDTKVIDGVICDAKGKPYMNSYLIEKEGLILESIIGLPNKKILADYKHICFKVNAHNEGYRVETPAQFKARTEGKAKELFKSGEPIRFDNNVIGLFIANRLPSEIWDLAKPYAFFKSAKDVEFEEWVDEQFGAQGYTAQQLEGWYYDKQAMFAFLKEGYKVTYRGKDLARCTDITDLDAQLKHIETLCAQEAEQARKAQEAEKRQTQELRDMLKALPFDKPKSEFLKKSHVRNLPRLTAPKIGLTGASIYGTGEWLLLDEQYLYYVQNNGMDSDDWSKNNLETGGAGAICLRAKRQDAQAFIDALCAFQEGFLAQIEGIGQSISVEEGIASKFEGSQLAFIKHTNLKKIEGKDAEKIWKVISKRYCVQYESAKIYELEGKDFFREGSHEEHLKTVYVIKIHFGFGYRTHLLELVNLTKEQEKMLESMCRKPAWWYKPEGTKGRFWYNEGHGKLGEYFGMGVEDAQAMCVYAGVPMNKVAYDLEARILKYGHNEKMKKSVILWEDGRVDIVHNRLCDVTTWGYDKAITLKEEGVLTPYYGSEMQDYHTDIFLTCTLHGIEPLEVLKWKKSELFEAYMQKHTFAQGEAIMYKFQPSPSITLYKVVWGWGAGDDADSGIDLFASKKEAEDFCKIYQ